jgi:hypothetical protein
MYSRGGVGRGVSSVSLAANDGAADVNDKQAGFEVESAADGASFAGVMVAESAVRQDALVRPLLVHHRPPCREPMPFFSL